MRTVRAAVLGIAASVLAAFPAAGVDVELSTAQQEEALAHGRALAENLETRGQAVDDFEPAYVVDLGPDVGRAVLFTEFSTLSLEARRWHAIRREIGRDDVEQALLPIRGRLRFSVVLVGARRDFLRQYTARLVQDDRRHAPKSWDVFRGAALGTTGRWQATAQYLFDAGALDLHAPAALVLSDGGAELRFDFPLDRLR